VLFSKGKQSIRRKSKRSIVRSGSRVRLGLRRPDVITIMINVLDIYDHGVTKRCRLS
jgi:hypothetical protein